MSTITKLDNKSGFSLIELIVTLGLGMLIGGSVLFVVTPNLKHIRTIRTIERLHSNALFLTDNIAYHIKNGQNLDLVSSSEIEIRMPDLSIKEIKQDNQDLTFDGVVFNTDDIEITNLNFTKLASSLRVNLTLQSKGSSENISVTTTVALRN